MFGSRKNRPAKILAGLCMWGVMMSPAVLAEEHALSLPQTAEAPVSLLLPEGLAGDPSDILQVFVGSAAGCCDTRTPVAGRYVHAGSVLSFTPAFGFSAGLDYVARMRQADSDALVAFRLSTDLAQAQAAVTKVFPSGQTLPENILRFYIHFTVPMRPGVAFDYITLRDASWRADDAAFMRFKQELWNADRTRLTVLMDPGRIKRNVATNVELGPALRKGRTYTLSVEGGWPSADGTSVLSGFSKRFEVGEPLRDLPDVRHWLVAPPCQGGRDRLTVSFDRPFDRHLLDKDIHVTAGDRQRIDGSVEISDGERIWSFTPTQTWSHRNIQIVVHPDLEDVAANNFRDLLDHVSGQSTEVPSILLPLDLPRCPD